MYSFFKFIGYAITGDAIRNPEKYQHYWVVTKTRLVCAYRNRKEQLKTWWKKVRTPKLKDPNKKKTNWKAMFTTAAILAFAAAIFVPFFVIFFVVFLVMFLWFKK